MEVQQNDQWVDAKAQNAVCAKCGSDRFHQHREWSETRAV
jgi:hypothetical protein